MSGVRERRVGVGPALWTLLVAASLIAISPWVAAQDEKKASAPKAAESTKTKPAEPPKAKAKADPKAEADVPAEEPSTSSRQEEFRDPRIAPTLPNTFPELKDAQGYSASDDSRVIGASSSPRGRVDSVSLDRFVRHYAAELTKHANIDPLLKGETTSRTARKIEEAIKQLLLPLRNAVAQRNDTFLQEYRRKLVEVLPTLLNNHLYARTQAALVLAKAEEPSAVPVFIQILSDPKQIITVKIWALQGLTELAQRGRNETIFRAQTQEDVIRAIYAMVKSDSPLPWPVEIRVLEALGSLRKSSFDLRGNQAGPAEASLQVLADPGKHPEVRTSAAWALGMMRVPNQISGYNFSLIAYHIGQHVVALGEETDRVFDVAVNRDDSDETKKEKAANEGRLRFNDQKVRYLVGLIVLAYRGFVGEPGARDTGLNSVPPSQPDIAAHRAMIQEIDRRIKQVAKVGVELTRVAGSAIPPKRREFKAAVDDLKSYLAANPPPSWKLVPGGPDVKGGAAPTPVAAAPKAANPAAREN